LAGEGEGEVEVALVEDLVDVGVGGA